MKGKHLILDLITYTPIDTIEDVEPLMEEIVKIGKLNVLDKLKHQFNPIGTTIIYLLGESHLSIHTYPESNYVAMDLYCCNANINLDDIKDYIYFYFNIKNANGRGQTKEIERVFR